MNLPTDMPEIQSPKFILQLFPRISLHTMHTLPQPAVRLASHARVTAILESFAAIKPLLLAKNEEHSSFVEFKSIEILGESIRCVHQAESVEDIFSDFVLLKSWMFCLELKTSSSRDVYGELGAKVVRLHFYGFLEAMIAYFPPSCRGRLETICRGEIPMLTEDIMMDGDYDISDLVERFWC